MSRNGTLRVSALIVCYCAFTIMPVNSSSSESQDKPVIYPDSSEDNRSNQIPESLLIQMNDIKNISQLLDFFGASDYGIGHARPIKPNGEPDDYNITASGGRKGLSGGMDIARAAGCEPEQQTVELSKPLDPTHVYWPMCIRLARCGGCCTSSLLTCIPVKTTPVEAKVIHAQYLSGDLGGQFEVIGFKSLKVERHDQCSCKCLERQEDCTPLQTYKREECRCMCKDVLAREKCTGSRWIWDPKECACKCRDVDECSSGFFFNGITCRCESQRSSLVGRKNFDAYNGSIPVRYSQGLNASQSGAVKSDSIKPKTTASTTTTTPTPLVVGRRGRIGAAIGEQVRYKTPVNVGIRPSDDDDSLVPFTSSRSQDSKQPKRIELSSAPLDTTDRGTTVKTQT